MLVCKGSGYNEILQIFVCILQQATPEQLRLAQLTSVNSKEDAEFEKKVVQVKMILFLQIFKVVPFLLCINSERNAINWNIKDKFIVM